MATIDTGAIKSTSTKRLYTTGSSAGSYYDIPESKRQNITTTNRYSPLKDFDSCDSDSSDSSRDINSTPKIDTLFKRINITTSKMAESELPTWAKSFQDELNASITRSVTKVIFDLSKKIDDLVESNKFLELSLDATSIAAREANQNVKALKAKIEQQDRIIKQQGQLISDAESYSKGYNLKLFNIPQDLNESRDELLQIFYDLCHTMAIDWHNIYIDNIHRLPANGKGPKPIIVKFVSKMDKVHVWERRSILHEKRSNIVIREHFDATTERNIRVLLPIRREAIVQKKM